MVRVTMTDRDIVERVGRLLGRAVLRLRPSRAGYKRPYATSVKGTPAVELMRWVFPLMSVDRQRQIDSAVASWHGKPARWSSAPEHCAMAGCPLPGARKGLCLRHYKRWWKARKARRVSDIVPVDPPAYTGGFPRIDGRLTGERATWWLAGLLEGEGHFGVVRTTSGDYPVLKLEMCAQDTVLRAAALLRAVSIERREPRKPAWRPTYRAKISGSDAAHWMKVLRPYMGERRTATIDSALSAYHPIRLVDPPRRCVVRGCKAPHRSRGLCHRHYMSWMRDVARGRTPRVTPLR
jgi:hypothetical protein